MRSLSSPFAYTVKLSECGSKHLALYLAIREAITEGKLAPGERLPSTRQLAALYDVSRGSVSVAYDMLTAEGFVQSGVGRGTFVSGWSADEGASRQSSDPNNGRRTPMASPGLTGWGRKLMELEAAMSDPLRDADLDSLIADPISFVPEGVGTGWFPWTEWKADVALQWKRLGDSKRDDIHSAEGSLALRLAIASRLRRERGITCDAGDIVITSGSMQAIALLSQLLLEEGKTAVIESPCYTGIHRAVYATGANVIAEQVDGSGIVPRDWKAQLLFVTPTRQFPTGAVLSYERRRELLSWASRSNGWIVEDDYDSDFRWGGRPIEPLKALDQEGRVVYVGTFSRSMSVGVRIGYAVLPKELIQPFIMAKKLYDPYPTGIAEQQALAGWMSEGGYDRHMRRMRRIYGKLENKLRASLEQELNGLFEVLPSDAGLHLYARWNLSTDVYERMVQECAKLGVTWRDGARYETSRSNVSGSLIPPSALFGFAHLDEGRIEEGIRRIGHAAILLGLIDSDKGQGGTVHA